MNQLGDMPSPEKPILPPPASSSPVQKAMFAFVVILAAVAIFVFVSERFGPMGQRGLSETVAVKGVAPAAPAPAPVASLPVAPTPEMAEPAAVNGSAPILPMIQRFDDLTARLDKLEKAAASADKTAVQESAALLQDVARMRNDMVALSGALGMLQSQIKQAMQSAEQVRSAAQGQMAVAIAFTQMRTVAAAGEGFAKELESLKKAAAQDPVITAAAVQLDSVAAKGAPSMLALRETFARMSGATHAALMRANAKDWKERIMAELMSLVSIRPLSGANGEGGDIAAIEKDLANNNIKAALDKVAKLPLPVQDMLKDWKAKVEARQELDAVLATIATHMIDQAMGKDTAQPVMAPAVEAPPVLAPEPSVGPAPVPTPSAAPNPAPEPTPAPSPAINQAPKPAPKAPVEPPPVQPSDPAAGDAT